MLNPAAGDPGASPIMLCGGVQDGLSVLLGPLVRHHHDHGQGHAPREDQGPADTTDCMDAACAFTAMAALAACALAIVLVPFLGWAPVGWLTTAADPLLRSRPPGTRLARGPPSAFC
jgi:hypothetical protein